MQNSPSITIRPGRKEDAEAIASYMLLASGGIIEFFLHDLVENVSPALMMRRDVEDITSEHSYTHTLVAELNGHIVGMAHSFPIKPNRMPEDSLIPKERLNHFAGLFECELPNSLYLHTIAIDPSHRGEKIGGALMRATEEKARNGGFTTLCLHVWKDNKAALLWYLGLGFAKMKSFDIAPDPFLPHTGGMFFMKKVL